MANGITPLAAWASLTVLAAFGAWLYGRSRSGERLDRETFAVFFLVGLLSYGTLWVTSGPEVTATYVSPFLGLSGDLLTLAAIVVLLAGTLLTVTVARVAFDLGRTGEIDPGAVSAIVRRLFWSVPYFVALCLLVVDRPLLGVVVGAVGAVVTPSVKSHLLLRRLDLRPPSEEERSVLVGPATAAGVDLDDVAVSPATDGINASVLFRNPFDPSVIVSEELADTPSEDVEPLLHFAAAQARHFYTRPVSKLAWLLVWYGCGVILLVDPAVGLALFLAGAVHLLVGRRLLVYRIDDSAAAVVGERALADSMARVSHSDTHTESRLPIGEPTLGDRIGRLRERSDHAVTRTRGTADG